jgi:hypothetical protein
LPNSLHKQLRECAQREGTSINQLITSAVGEKLAALMTEEYLTERARRGRRRKFESVLKSVPDAEPEERDRLPPKRAGRKRRPIRR